MFALENAAFACGVRSARERSFEEARGETEVGWRLQAPRPLPPQTPPPPGTQTESQLEPATSAGVILPETGQFLLLCWLQLWQQLQRCRQTRARVPLFLIHFTSVLRNEFAANDVSWRSERLQTSTCVKKLAAVYECRLTDAEHNVDSWSEMCSAL